MSLMETVTGFNGGFSFEEKTFQWKIGNFSTIAKIEELLNQQKVEFEFLTSNGVKSAWRAYLRLSKAGTPAAPTKTIRLCLGLIEKNGCCSETQALLYHEIKDSSGEIISTGTPGTYVTYTKNLFIYWSVFDLSLEGRVRILGTRLPVAELNALTDDTLIINTTVKFLIRISEPTFRVDDEAICDNQRRKLCQKLGTLVNDPNHSDVKIVCSDGKVFFAYRWILSGISKVFAAMFRTDMAENQTGIVEIKNVSGITFKVILNFFYTGKMGAEWSQPGIVEELIYATEKYQLKLLKDFLDANLGKICTAENAGSLLAFTRSTSLDKAAANIRVFIEGKDADGLLEIVKK